MKKQMSNWSLFSCFAAVTGTVIAALVWLYLKVANVGVTIIWDMIPKYVDVKGYTIWYVWQAVLSSAFFTGHAAGRRVWRIL
ncbi:MAG: hypothetical protein V8R80_12195 [Eubacterium sp.]